LVTVIKALFLVGATPKMGFYFFITKKLSGRVAKVKKNGKTYHIDKRGQKI